MDNAKVFSVEDPLVRVPGIVSAKFSPIRLVEYEQWKSFLGGQNRNCKIRQEVQGRARASWLRGNQRRKDDTFQVSSPAAVRCPKAVLDKAGRDRLTVPMTISVIRESPLCWPLCSS